MKTNDQYPVAIDKALVGTYSHETYAGGGDSATMTYDVLEYRVWCHPLKGGSDCCKTFANFNDAQAYFEQNDESESIVVLIRQWGVDDNKEWAKKGRLTEWLPKWLKQSNTRSQRNER